MGKESNLLKINDMVIKLYHCPKCDYEAGERIAVIDHIYSKHPESVGEKGTQGK